MIQSIAKNLQCIVMRNGIKLWIEKEKIQKLHEILSKTNENKFIQFNTDNVERMRLISSGFLGVGITVPRTFIETKDVIIQRSNTWTSASLPENNQCYGIVYGNGIFVAVHVKGVEITSSPLVKHNKSKAVSSAELPEFKNRQYC
jgi:hypothetical protein